MKNLKNKKGFTIVELVIVVAVIAILAAVLIPTFSNVVGNAQEAALKSNLKNIYSEYVADAAEDGKEIEETVVIVITEEKDGSTTSKYYKVVNGVYEAEVAEANLDDADTTDTGTTPLYENVYKYKD